MSKPDENAPIKPYVPPVMTVKRRIEITNAMALHVQANRSDPFAGGRVKMHMERGLELPSEIRSEAEARLNAKRSQD